MTPGYARVKAYRQRRREAGEADTTRARSDAARKAARARYKAARRSSWRQRPFCGCDGEGAGKDDQGRQQYLLFRMGDRELWRGGAPLTTLQLLKFICAHPPDQLLVGFAFGYDVTMILRDLEPDRAARLFAPRSWGSGKSPFVWFHHFDVEYLPRQYFRVRRVRFVRDADGIERRVPVKGSTRTIWETFGFFQKPFLKVLEQFDVGTEAEREEIAVEKSQRGSEDWTIGDRERAYCAQECRFLAETMTKLREYCDDADIRPRSWSGAGRLAAALHDREKTIRGEHVAQLVPPGVIEHANMAYYGGRFEVTRTGLINKRVWEYDIRSAYPAAMRDLPCLVHGRWSYGPCAKLPEFRTCVASVRFVGRSKLVPGGLGGLPVRTPDGHLVWPWRGGGVYWSQEYNAARKLGFALKIGDGWIYEKCCDCKPFDWVEDLYEYRRSIGSTGAGYPIKLGINALYGKLAQRKGNGAYNNLIWAGLITAACRAQLVEATAEASPGAVLMLATDALYSTEPLALPVGPWLGNWEETQLDGLFIVQPGLYWSPDRAKRKARGLPGRFFEGGGMTDDFERTWARYRLDRLAGRHVDRPSVRVPVPGFVGLRLALSRNDHGSAGRWVSDHRKISFDWSNKRSGGSWEGEAIVTTPKLGSTSQLSLPHRDFLRDGGAEPWEAARLQLEEQPDFVDLSAPWSD